MRNRLRRRDFLKAALATGGLATTGGLLPWGINTVYAAAPTFSDYKAMVCIFLQGGNDSYNMLVPFSNSDYQDTRFSSREQSNLRVADSNLAIPAIPNDGTKMSNPYQSGSGEEDIATAYLKGVYKPSGLDINGQGALGVNAVMPELARLVEDKKASVVSNVGALVKPVSQGTKSHALSDAQKTADLPKFLFAHNHQRRVMQTGIADQLNASGWAGRIADLWSGVNSPLGLNISYYGNNRMLIGDSTTPLVLSAKTPTKYDKMVEEGATNAMRLARRRQVLFRALAGKNDGLDVSNSELNLTNKNYPAGDVWRDYYGGMLQNSESVVTDLADKWADVSDSSFFTRKDPYGNPLFTDYADDGSDIGLSENVKGKLTSQLDAVARMIYLGKNSYNFNRQIFFVELGGFDTHGGQNKKHPALLRELSINLWNFQMALEEKGLANNVTTFTMSDFGRTLTNNGDGTDHAWGANHIVMGGDGNNTSGNLEGGQLFGTLPNLAPGGDGDYSRNKGRIIPTTSQDQLSASICQWFGVPTTDIETTLFPNLTNFSTKYLNLFAS